MSKSMMQVSGISMLADKWHIIRGATIRKIDCTTCIIVAVVPNFPAKFSGTVP